MPKEEKIENKNKEKKQRKPMDKRKLAQTIIIVFMIIAMLLSVAGTLIYYLTHA